LPLGNTINELISSAIACIECKAFKITGCTISEFNSVYGGGFYLATQYSREFTEDDFNIEELHLVKQIICV
jgi:hypothetical protein